MTSHPVHVNAASPAEAPDGRGWASAFRDLQDALALGAVEIWVAAGTYVPGNARTATFQLHPGQALYGGFLGRETQRGARDAETHRTVLDGNSVHHVVTGADGATSMASPSAAAAARLSTKAPPAPPTLPRSI